MGILGDVFDFAFGWMMPDPPKQEYQGTELTSASTDAHITKIYGKVDKHNGHIIFKKTNDADDDDIKNDLLHIIVVWSEAVESIDEVYIDDEPYSSDSSIFFDDDNKRRVHVRNFVNGMDGYDDDILAAAGWRPNDKCLGKACTYVRIEAHQGESAISGEPKIQADITGTTNTNPGFVLKDYLMSPIYGKGLSAEYLNLAAFDACDQLASSMVEEQVGSGVMRPLFSCNVALDTSNTVFDNAKTILTSMRAMMPILNGKLTPIIEKDDPPVDIVIEERDVIEMGKFKNSAKKDRYNQVIVEYVEPGRDGTKQEAVYPPVGSAEDVEWLEEDNGFRLSKSVELHTCRNYYEALEYAKSLARVSRQQYGGTVVLPKWATIFEVGDVVVVNHSYFGWDEQAFAQYGGKPFRITSTNESRDQVELALREHQPYIYDFFGEGNKPEFPDSGIDTSRPPKPDNFSVEPIYDGNRQVRVRWEGTTTHYDYQVVSVGGEVLDSGRIGTKYIVISNYSLGTYTVRVKAVASMARTSLWSDEFDVTINGLEYFTWKLYADDLDGTNTSKTDSSKPYVGYLYGQLQSSFNIYEVDVSKFGFFPNTAAEWLFGSGAPDSNVGVIGNSYLNNDNGDVWKKTASGWSQVGNIGGADGDKWISGTTSPSSGTGSNGDWYLNTTNYKLWHKVSGTWEPRGTIKGEQGDKGEKGEPGVDAANVVSVEGQRWSFRGYQGWSVSNANYSVNVNKGVVTIAPTTTNPYISSPSINMDGRESYIIMPRIRTQNPSHSITLRVYYSNDSHGFTGSYSFTVDVDLTFAKWQHVIIDLREASDSVFLDYISSPINRIRLDFENGVNGQQYQIDSLLCGYAGGADATNYDDDRISNNGITIGSDGRLIGGGGGQVTRSGIGAESPAGAQARADNAYNNAVAEAQAKADAAYEAALDSELLRNPSGEGVNFLNPRYFDPNDGIPLYVHDLNAPYINRGAQNYPGDIPNSLKGGYRYNTTTPFSYLIFADTNSDYNMKLIPNRSWLVSFYALRHSTTSEGNGDPDFEVHIGTPSGLYTSDEHYEVRGYQRWERVALVVDVNDNEEFGYLRIDVDNTDGALAYVAGIMVEPYISGSGKKPSPLSEPLGTSPIFETNRLPATVTIGAGSTLTSPAFESPPDSAYPNRAMISVSSHTLYTGDGGINYNSGKIRNLPEAERRFVYVEDPYYVGASAYQSTTDIRVVTGNNLRRYLGAITTYNPNSGGTQFPEPGDCPHIDTWLTDSLQVKDAKMGDVINGVTGGIGHKSQIKYIYFTEAECVRLLTKSGASIIVSMDTPIDRPDGSTWLAPNGMLGHGEKLLVSICGESFWDDIESIESVGIQPVAHMNCGDISFFGGESPDARVCTHNRAFKP